MDYLAKMSELQEQKNKIEEEMKSTVEAWVSSIGLSDGDKFIFKAGAEKGKICQVIHGRTYKFLKKDGTPNNQRGLQFFWVYEMKYAEIEKL